MALKSIRELGWLRVLLAAELAFGLIVAGGLWLLRVQTLDGEARMLDALARALALQADRTLGIGQAQLMATADELARGLIAPSGPQTDALLRERARALPGFRAMSLFDPEGQRTATSREPGAPPPQGVAGRDFFRAARDAGRPQLVLSDPYVALGDDRPAVSLSIGWFDARGHFGGVLALVAEPDFLAADLGPLRPMAGGQDIRQAILRRDQPLPAQAAGRGSLSVAVPLKQLPLVQLVWRDADAVLAGWTDLAWLVGIFATAMLSVTLAVGLRMARDQLRVAALEERLARSRKLEALGQLAGGVAHDFNNVLSAVRGFGEMARSSSDAQGRQARHIDQVLQAAERGRQQVERILAFSRGQARRSESFLLQPVVQEVLDHLAAAQRGSVVLQGDLQAPALALRGDSTATYQAVMNLCTNALQAMPEGGTLAVTLDDVQLDRARQTYDALLPAGHYLRLQVRDSGAGMPPEVLARLFEPFYTTRASQGGTGIGLAVVHGVVADLGGGIDVDSSPGRGSCFTLLLPVCSDPPPDPAAAEGDLPRGQGQTILVVDDDPALVELAEEMLADLGYEPRATTSPERALQALREQPAAYDLLLTDEVMPVLGGLALVQAARALRPDLPVVLASGYGGEHFERRAAEAGVRQVLAKPLSRRQLAQALQAALQARLQP